MEKLELDRIKKLELEILKHFSTFCINNDIRYFLSNGTLLGAVKYKGFIPWDDDIDVFVPREDYNRLILTYQDSKKYHLFSSERNSKFKYPFAKLCDMTTRKEEKNIDNGVELGLDIDIFPLDFWPDNELKAKIYIKKIKKCVIMLNFSKLRFNKGQTPVRTLVKILVILFARCIGAERIVKRIQSFVKKKYSPQQKYLGCVVWPVYGEKEIIPKDVFSDNVEVEFEGTKFLAPIGYDVYLKCLYGDYEQDPPLEKQYTHHDFQVFLVGNITE